MSHQTHQNHLEFNRSILPGVEVKSCKNTPHSYKAHVHHELSLGYILHGSTNLTINNNTVHYTAGDAVIIPPLLTHRCEPNNLHDWQYLMLYIDPAIYEDSLFFSKPKSVAGSSAQKLYQFITKLLNEHDDSILENILIDLLISFSDELPPIIHSSNSVLLNIRNYIQAHPVHSISLDFLQNKYGLNKFSIIRSFKSTFNTTPAAYHLQCRIAEAKNMLVQNIDVFEICEKLGFYDQAHFIKTFKSMHGITPAKYVEQLT